MSEFDKNNNINTNTNEDMNINNQENERVWTADGPVEQDIPRVEDLTEEEIYKILQEDAGDIEPPPSLSPASIEKMLQGVKQEQKGRRSPWLMIAGMAACLVFGVMAGLLTFSLIHNRDVKTDSPISTSNQSGDPGTQGDPDVVAELDYDEVCDIINNFNGEIVSNREQKKNIEYEIEDAEYVTEEASESGSDTSREGAPAIAENSKSESATAPGSGASSDYSKTDEQVAGVEEGDIVKTDGKHIFTIEPSTFGFTIHVIEPKGSQSREIGQVEIPECDCSEMYINGNQIIVIGNEWIMNENGGHDRIYYGGRSYAQTGRTNARTQINIIDISDPSRPRIAKKHTQTGSFNTSRISDGHLYTFTEDTYYREEPYAKGVIEDYVPKIDEEAMPVNRIVRAGEEDTNNYMVLMSIALDGSNEITDKMAVLGGGATYYVSSDNIYIARNTTVERMMWEFGTEAPTLTTSLNKFSYNDGKFTKGPSTTFRGYIDNSYYMHEYQGNFCFVYMNLGSDYETINWLCVMDGNLNKLGELRNIAPGEEIHASYYMDNMAYFVTYHNTDPVFAVDLSDPTSPRLCSELKLPGFSSYLHSFGENQLIGIGYGDASKDGQGWDDTAKLSLFSIGADYDIKELSKVFAEQGARHIADENHRAVFIDEKRGLVGLGMTSYGGEDPSVPRDLQHYVVYQLNGSKLVKVMDTADDLDLPPLMPRNTRGLRIGETFYVCDVTGVQTAYTIGSHGAKWKKA